MPSHYIMVWEKRPRTVFWGRMWAWGQNGNLWKRRERRPCALRNAADCIAIGGRSRCDWRHFATRLAADCNGSCNLHDFSGLQKRFRGGDFGGVMVIYGNSPPGRILWSRPVAVPFCRFRCFNIRKDLWLNLYNCQRLIYGLIQKKAVTLHPFSHSYVSRKGYVTMGPGLFCAKRQKG